MTYKITLRMERILEGLAHLADSVREWLPSASQEARRECDALRRRCPSELEVREGAIVVSDDELALMESKGMRFRDILAARPSLDQSSRLSPASNGDAD